MSFRLPRSIIRLLLRVALKPFIRPPFGFRFQRAWVRLNAGVNVVDRRATRATMELAGMSTLRVSPPTRQSAHNVLYLHGGGYCWGSSGTHASLVTRLSASGDAVVYAPNYRLAPEHPHPAALEDAVAAYEWILDEGVSPDALALAGDSAGAGLALATALAVRDRGLALPSCVVLISPWVDLRGDSRSILEKAAADPMLSPSGVQSCSAAYRAGHAVDDPACSPLLADHGGLPPMLIHVGSDEILLDDSTRLAERCRSAGVDVTLKMYENLWHDFHIHAGMMRESDEAIEEIAAFMKQHWR